MAETLEILDAATRHIMLTAVTSAVDGGRLELLDSSNIVLGSVALANPAFEEDEGNMVLSGLPLTVPISIAGTLAKARFVDEPAGGDDIFQGSVGLAGSGAFIEAETLTLTAGGSLQLLGCTILVAPHDG